MSQERYTPPPPENIIKEKAETNRELVDNAELALRDFLCFKPDERFALISDKTSDRQVIETLKQAAERIGVPVEELVLDEKTKKKDITDLFQRNQVVMDVSMGSADHKATEDIWETDFLEKAESRLAYNPGLEVVMFQKDGALTENSQDLQNRLDKMEAVLYESVGFNITSSYGTDLVVPLRSDKERRWCKDNGVISRPGQWGNMPGGEIFTTPDQHKVNGVLVLPAVDMYTDIPQQGVDEFVRLTFRDGVVTKIQGGQSAERLRQQLEKAAQEQIADAKKKKSYYERQLKSAKNRDNLSSSAKREKMLGIIRKANKIIASEHNPFNVLRIAEIAFGANSRARSVVDAQKPYDQPGVPTIEKEKRLGTMHLALGSSKHGEEEGEGFYNAVSHLDFVIPRNGLTVEMYTDKKNLDQKKDGRRIIDHGGINLF